MSNKNASRILALFIAPVIGAILGFFLTDIILNGWLSSSWQTIPLPPVHVSSFAAVNGDSLWVRSDSGEIYYNEISSICASDCWRKVDEIPVLPILDHALKVTNKSCAPVPPLWGVIASISECRTTSWQDENNTFALLNDGTIYLWQASLYGEGAFFLLWYGVIAGAVVLFVLTLIFVLFFLLIDWLSNAARSKQANNGT